MEKESLEEFFEKNKNILLVLSIFLLVTIELVSNSGYLNNILATLSALISYIMLIGIESQSKEKDSWQLRGFKIILPILVSAFCLWVILNIAITITGEVEKIIWIIIWLILMIIPTIRFFKKGAIIIP